MTSRPSCKLWTTGTWGLASELGGSRLCFSSDSRLVAVLDSSRIICLVETETGSVLAGLESPDSCDVVHTAFSPDGSRLVLLPDNHPAVYLWDLRAVHRNLAAVDLDWDAAAPSR
jgi:WD40 repeat protein